MPKDRLLLITCVLAIFGTLLFFLADAFYFFYFYWWFDIIMHFLVAFTGGLGLYWGFFHSGVVFRQEFSSQWLNVFIVFIGVLLWASAWEVFENINGMTQSTEGYPLDTLNDLMIGGVGGFLSALWASRKNRG